MADWYATHLGLRIVHRGPPPHHTRFIADPLGGMIEIYCNPPDAVPDHAHRHPLQFHLGWESTDPDGDARRLIAAGASAVDDCDLADGSRLVMLRDPWGVPLQLCRRTRSLA
jgi:catechol 2,3-dioxygenase-like lactoylglutathione lyase family enzyme